MSEEEDVKKYIRDTIELTKCNVYKLKNLLAHQYNVSLRRSDVTFIEDEYASVVLKLWQEQCKNAIESKVNILRGNRVELKEFISKVNENDFDSFRKLVRTDYGTLIENDRNLFESDALRVAYNEIIFYIKKKIEQIQSHAIEEYKFLKAFIEVLRGSNFEYKNVIKKLKLHEYSEHKVTIEVVIYLIIINEFEIDSYRTLQSLAYELRQNPLQVDEDVIRFEITPFIVPVDKKSIDVNGRSTLQLIGKILFLSDCFDMLDQDTKDVQIICDILHISRDSKENHSYHFNVDNLIIIANEIKVYDEVTIDLSGKNAKTIEEDERGINGRDGYAGESGGNISVACSKVVNGNLLTLVSNGGSATDGLDGLNGTNGIDGKDVCKENLSWNGKEFRTGGIYVYRFPQEQRKDSSDNLLKLSVIVRNWYRWRRKGFLLAKGEEGTPGTNGGLGGLGGMGGYEGEVKLDIPQGTFLSIQVNSTPGKDGKEGKSGFNGIHGVDGGDAWAFDKEFWFNPVHFGLGNKYRYKVEECNRDHEYAVWSDRNNAYMTVVYDGTIPSQNNYRCRNEFKAVRSKSKHAIAKHKKRTYSRHIKTQYSEYLKSSLDRIKNNTHDDIYIKCDENKTTNKDKIKTTCERPQKSFKKEEIHSFEFLSYEEVKNKFSKKDLKVNDFLVVMRKIALLTANQCIEIKQLLIKVDNQQRNFLSNWLIKTMYGSSDIIPLWDDRTSLLSLLTKRCNENLQGRNFFSNCFSKNNYGINDITPLWDDKTCLSMFENQFPDILRKKKIIFNNKRKPLIEQPSKVEDLIPYLFDSKEFRNDFKDKQTYIENVDFAALPYYFNTDGKINREQITDFYSGLKKKVLKSYSKGKFDKLKSYLWVSSDKKDITICEKFFTTIIEMFFKHKNELIELKIPLASLEEDYDSTREFFYTDNVKVSTLIKKFLENPEISSFIERNLLSKGVILKIYRKIISFAFQTSFRIFVKGLDGSITMCEENDVKEFWDESNAPMLNILMKNQRYSLLEFNKNKYVKHQERKYLAEECSELFKNWEPLANYFRVDQNFNSLILRNFKNEGSYYDEVVLALDALNNTAPLILKSISSRLFYEENVLTIKEFHTIVHSIFDLVTENSFMINYFTVKLLAIHHSKWIHEIIIIKLEDLFNNDDLSEIRNLLLEVKHRETLLLFLTKLEEHDEQALNVSLAELKDIVYNMQFFTNQTYEQLSIANELNSWKFVTTSGYWLKKYKFLTENKIALINDLQSKYGTKNLEKLLSLLNDEAIGLLDVEEFFKNFHTGEWILSDELFNLLKKISPNNWMKEINEIYLTKQDQRSIDQVVRLVAEGFQTCNTSTPIKNNMKSIGERTKNIISWICSKTKTEFSKFSLSDVCDWLHRPSKSIEDQIAIILRVFKLEMNVSLRYTQIISILTLWYNEHDVLLQIGTGEGKTFIAVALAILKVLNQEKIHIVSSSNVLAERDAVSEENLKIFKIFNIKVGHNCSEDSDERRGVYKDCDVVYGTLGNFQRDYLFTKFFNQNLLPADQLQNVLVDEVDSILLDKGNNILYLSQEIPGIDELDSIFIFLWQFVNMDAKSVNEKRVMLDPKNIRDVFLDNLYGVVNETDIKGIIGENEIIDSTAIIEELKDIKVINSEGCILIENLEDSIKNIEREFNSMRLPSDISSKIMYLISQKFNSPKQVKFPKFYTEFVMHHLDKWIESALSALVMDDGREYIIDSVRDGSAIRNDPNIIIMDVDTGTDQKNSEWDEGLCQFLQLKHGCRLSLLSLKSVFISNVTYFRYYKKKYGITGTLGSQSECVKIENFYKLQYATIPTYLPKKFIEREAIVAKSNDEWLNKIVGEVKALFNEGRSVLVICNTIKEVEIILCQFQNDESKTFNEKNIRAYQRDYEEFDLGMLKPRQLIIATNLAGRGTDIKLSSDLARNGGLHVIMAYLASNVRIENQAYGRAARAGANGSARLIVMQSSTSSDINTMKEQRSQEEFQRLENVSSFYENFIKNEEGLFAKFSDHFTKYERRLKEYYERYENVADIQAILCDNFKVLWSLWLDLNSKLIVDWKNNETKIWKLIEDLIEETSGEILFTKIKLHPIMRIRVCKYLDSVKKDIEAKSLCYNEKFTDSIAYEHLKTFILLKSQNILCTKEVRSLIKKFTENEIELSSRISIINALKEKYQRTLIPIKGYENQVNEIIDAQKIIVDGLEKMLGRGVTPETFQCAPFGNSIFNEEFYDFLMKNNYIEKPKVDVDIDPSDIAKIAKNYYLDVDDLGKILSNWKGRLNITMQGIANFLNENLKFASREAFWQTLINEKILKKETKYALVDVKTLREYLPSYEETIQNHFSALKFSKLCASNEKEIFFENVHDTNSRLENSNLLALEYNDRLKNDKYFQILLEKKLVKFNYKATFSLESYKQSKLKFSSFDSISREDFDFIKLESVRDQVIATLLEQKVLHPDSASLLCSKFGLVFENLDKINLGINSIYESEVLSVLAAKFQFRIALEMLADETSCGAKSSDINIYLHSNPHLMIIQDLISEFIIIPARVNVDKYKELESDDIFDKYISREVIVKYLKCGYFDSTFTLPSNVKFESLVNVLLQKKILFQLTNDKFKILNLISMSLFHKSLEGLDSEEYKMEYLNYIQYRFSGAKYLFNTSFSPIVVRRVNEDVKLSDNFKNIESSVRILLNRRKQFVDNKNAIIEVFKDCIESFSRRENDKKEAVMVPLQVSHEMLHFMQLKGLDYVIQVSEKKYIWSCYFKVTATIIIGIAQISAGIAFTIMSSGSFLHLGNTLISEGIGDIIYAINTLRSGVFKWSDYETHKAISVATTVAISAVTLGLAKLRILNEAPFVASAQTESLIWENARSEFGKQLASNTFNAVTMAGVSMSVDYAVNNLLDSIMMEVASAITNAIQSKYI